MATIRPSHPPRRDTDGYKDEEKAEESPEASPAASLHRASHQHHGYGHEHPLTDQTNYLTPLKAVLAFTALGTATLLAVIDSSIVANAVAAITEDLGRGDLSAWVGASYLITMAGFCCVAGRLGDIFGRKLMTIAAIIEFTLASLACALAQTMMQLIVFRAFQGVGGAALMCLAQGMSADLVPLEKRPRYQLTIEVIMLVGNAGGPILGGVFANFDWRWCFWINLPLGAVALLGIIFLIPSKSIEGNILQKLRRTDWIGAAIVLASSASFLLALNQGGDEHPWASYNILLPLIFGLFGFVLFCVWERYAVRIPLIPMYIFKNPTVTAICFNTFMSGALWYLLVFYLPLYFELAKGQSVIMAGVLLLPLMVVVTPFVVLSVLIMKWANGHYKELILVGFAVLSVALGLMSTVQESTSIAHVIGYLVIAAASNAFTLQTTIIGVQAAILQKDVAVTLSARLFSKQIGGAIGVVVGSAILNNFLASAGVSDAVKDIVTDAPLELSKSSVPSQERDLALNAFIDGFRVIFIVGAAFSALAFFGSLPIKSYPLKREEAKKHESDSEDSS